MHSDPLRWHVVKYLDNSEWSLDHCHSTTQHNCNK